MPPNVLFRQEPPDSLDRAGTHRRFSTTKKDVAIFYKGLIMAIDCLTPWLDFPE
jgi:hypothetical protein